MGVQLLAPGLRSEFKYFRRFGQPVKGTFGVLINQGGTLGVLVFQGVGALSAFWLTRGREALSAFWLTRGVGHFRRRELDKYSKFSASGAEI